MDPNNVSGAGSTGAQDGMMAQMEAITRRQEQQSVQMAEMDARGKLADGLAKRIKASADSVKSAA